ncbi:MAG TPA: VOC family protein [Polyangiales bacterium]|nr:VOC family protein [Polyangiales bacterium]
MDHISVPVRDTAKTRDFYEAIFEPLGWKRSGFRAGVYVGFKEPGSPALYFHMSDTVSVTHLAFKAFDAEQVAAFYSAGLAVGGRDNGAPGPRPDYGKDYYAGFVFDPDGHNVEAVVGGVG